MKKELKQKKQKKPKKQTKLDVLAGIKAGKRYLRPYGLDGGFVDGVEKLIPVGDGPPFTKVRHVCDATTGGDDEETTSAGVEDLDEDLLDNIIRNGRWVQF